MIYPNEIRPQQPIRASDIRDLAVRANNASNVTGGKGVNTASSPAGITIQLSSSQRKGKNAILCRAWNSSATALLPYAPAKVVGLMDEKPETEIILEIVPVDAGTTEGNLVVCQDGLREGAVGNVAVLGLTLVRAYMENLADVTNTAEIVVNVNQALKLNDAGTVDVLWSPVFSAINTVKHTLVRLGGGAAAAVSNVWVTEFKAGLLSITTAQVGDIGWAWGTGRRYDLIVNESGVVTAAKCLSNFEA